MPNRPIPLKTNTRLSLWIALLLPCLLLLMMCSPKLRTKRASSPSALIKYKESKHHVFVGFLVGDGNDPAAGFNPANAPDSADYLEFFAGRDSVRTHWREAQAKGTRIIACHFPTDAYFDGSAKDPATKVAGYIAPAGFDPLKPNATSTYHHWARDTYQKEIIEEGLDGIDIDIERGTFGKDVPNPATNGKNLLLALAEYYGPNCTSCRLDAKGRKPTFFYDTDGSARFEDSMYQSTRSNYDLVLFQAYTTGSRAWRGKGVGDLPPLATRFGVENLVFLVNGDSFIKADGSQDRVPEDSAATADLYAYANWVKSHNAAGVGVYRMSRDFNHKPPFAASRKAIQLMNPAEK